MPMNGIDVSGYQPANIGDLVPYDFLIAKATEGNTYTSGRCNQQVQSALSKGKRIGVYHFASGKPGAEVEADYFVSQIKAYIGRAVLILDWEASAVAKGPGYAKAFLDRVFASTGVRPLIYMSTSVTNAYDWSAVRNANYGLWAAAYGRNPAQGYSVPAAPSVGYWGTPSMFQFGSQGSLPGYGASLDINVFYGDGSAWDAFAAVNGQVTLPPSGNGGSKPAPATPTAVNLTTYSWQSIQAKIGAAQDGIPGPETYAKLVVWQKANGLVPDGIVGPATADKMFGAHGSLDVDGILGSNTIKALQAALGVSQDGVLGPQTYKALQARVGASQDGIYGPDTKKALQRYLGVAQDGIVGPNTIKALQTRLNNGTF